MGKLKECTWSETYQYTIASDDNPEPIEFYMEGLLNSNKLHLLLGYFSSSAISLLAPGFAYFISNGGELTMIINQFLSSKDKEAFERGLEGKIEKAFDLTDVSSLENTLNKYDVHFFQCLAYLISEKRIRFQIIRPKMGNGISHYKQGIFYDGENKVGFSGSCNFTSYGFLHNRENLNVYLGWEEGYPKTWINTNERLFEKYVKQEDEKVEYLPLEKIEIAIKEKFGGNLDIQGLLSQEEDLIKEKLGLTTNPEIHKVFEKASKKIKEKMVNQTELESKTPKFPYPEGPRPYQVEAYQNWIANNYKGLFAMATGTGKTITSLNCLLQEYEKNKTYYGIILVPSKALLDQWIKEVSIFNFTNIIAIGGGHNGIDQLPNFVSNFKAGLKRNIIIITTYISFSSEKFQKNFSKIQDSFVLIADEAHNMGATQIKKVMTKLTIPKRIGLSATPKRKYDPEGTDSICQFFNDNPPFCYNFGMKRAMAEGRLTDYYYYPKIVQLDEDEKEKYVKISLKLFKFFDFEKGYFKKSPVAERLLLERKAIIHQARRKIPAYKEILKELDKNGKLKFVFTYVPVGASKEQENNNDIENKFVYLYLKAAQEVKPDLKASTYTSETEDRVSKITAFAEGKIDMLLAMKMLDEGVDIPRAEIGVFASSTGNPREFIQRRGRLLRIHKDKKFAHIYDMIVAPVPANGNESLFRIEKNMVRNELIRVAYFASLSMNFYDSKNVLQDICDKYELDLDEILTELEND